MVEAVALLRDGERRRAARAVILDGPALVDEALGLGVVLRWALGDADEALRDRLEAVGVPVAPAAPDALRALGALGQPARLVALAALPAVPPEGPLPPGSLVLAGVRDEGNLGSIVRTALAFRRPAVALDPACGDPWSRRALRAARAASLAPGLVHEGWRSHDADPPLAAAVPRGGVAPADLPEGACVVLGGEHEGLDAATRRACAVAVTVPAPGFESLNVAAAAAVLCHELARRAAEA